MALFNGSLGKDWRSAVVAANLAWIPFDAGSTAVSALTKVLSAFAGFL